MAVMLNEADFTKEVMFDINIGANKALDGLVAGFFHGVAEKLPVEDGHAHEAFRAAASDLSTKMMYSKRTWHAHRRLETKASGDPDATNGGFGSFSRTQKALSESITAEVEITLPFVRKLEYGQNIYVGDKAGNKGPKQDGVPLKKLYGPRRAGSGGLLQWRENGKIKRAKVRRLPSGFGFFRHGISRVEQLAKGN